MTPLRRLALFATGATLILIAIGGLVRATKSGLGCGTDWPDCGGRLVPALATRAEIIEFSHRAVAGVVIVLVAALATVAVARHRGDREIVWPAVGAFALVMWQAVLGMLVVKLRLDAASVVLHLLTALILLAVLVFLTAALRARAGSAVMVDPGAVRLGKIGAASVLVLLLVGSYVTGTGAGLVFPDWPLMNGSLLPDLRIELQAIHFLHRLLALVVGGVVAIAAVGVIRRKEDLPLQAKLAHAAGGLFVLNIIIGALNIWTDLNALAVTLHLVVGTLVWGAFVTIAAVSRPLAEPSRQPASTAAVLEGSR